jgi:hypothetical protein
MARVWESVTDEATARLLGLWVNYFWAVFCGHAEDPQGDSSKFIVAEGDEDKFPMWVRWQWGPIQVEVVDGSPTLEIQIGEDLWVKVTTDEPYKSDEHPDDWDAVVEVYDHDGNTSFYRHYRNKFWRSHE